MSTRLDLSNLDLMDALDMATLIEEEAHKRYVLFNEQLGDRGVGDAASVFASMAENEAKHGEQLAERRKALFGDKPMRVTLLDVFDVEAPETGAVYATMSTLQAFEVALESEQKAYDFYDEALPHVADKEIRELFTELRDEETEHVRMVKEAIAGLPPEAAQPWDEDADEYPAL
jgi:rubrerythrin